MQEALRREKSLVQLLTFFIEHDVTNLSAASLEATWTSERQHSQLDRIIMQGLECTNQIVTN